MRQTFFVTGATATAGTAFTAFIPPQTRTGGTAPFLYQNLGGSAPSNVTWWGGKVGRTHINNLGYVSGTTAHTLVVMRPLNWVRITTAVAANSQTVVLEEDPGIYSTNFNYPINGTQHPAAAADNGIAGSDYVAFQLVDGTWHFSAVTSVSTLTLTITTATPNVTGGGAAANTPLFFFGASTDTSPLTGRAHPAFNPPIPASGELLTTFCSAADEALVSTIFPGDPMMLYSGNGTAAGRLTHVSGFYDK